MVAWSLTGRESAITVLARRIRAGRVRLGIAVRFALRLVLVLAACVCAVTAAWMVAVPLGLLTASGALLFLEWLVKDGAR